MKFKIYDYNNEATEVDVNGKTIDHITVIVLSGDEMVKVFYKDGTNEEFDSSGCRNMDYFDGMYELHGTELFKWLTCEPDIKDDDCTISYERLRDFT